MLVILRILICACVILSAFPLQSDTTKPTFEDVRNHGEQALTSGDPQGAIDAAEILLNQNPDDYQALLLLSLANTQLGQHKPAALAAKHAFHTARDDAEKLQAARITGGAYFNNNQFNIAQYWLRRAANHTSTNADTALVKQEFQAIRQQNPLSVNLSFSVAPSNNINGGAEDEFFFLDEFQFQFSPESRALSGIEYAGDVNLTYQISNTQTQSTSLGAYFYGRTFSLSSETKATVPNASGSDYALGQAEASLYHRRLLFKTLGPTEVSTHIGKIWYGGKPLWRYNKLALSQDIAINQKSSATIRTFIEKREGLDDVQPNSTLYDAQALYARRLANLDILQLSLGYHFNDADQETYTHTDIRASLRYTLDKPILGAGLSFSMGLGHKNYDEFSLALNGRQDNYISLGATAVFQNISYFGFSPSFSLAVSKTNSNVTRFSNVAVQGKFGIQSNF